MLRETCVHRKKKTHKKPHKASVHRKKKPHKKPHKARQILNLGKGGGKKKSFQQGFLSLSLNLRPGRASLLSRPATTPQETHRAVHFQVS